MVRMLCIHCGSICTCYFSHCADFACHFAVCPGGKDRAPYDTYKWILTNNSRFDPMVLFSSPNGDAAFPIPERYSHDDLVLCRGPTSGDGDDLLSGWSMTNTAHDGPRCMPNPVLSTKTIRLSESTPASICLALKPGCQRDPILRSRLPSKPTLSPSNSNSSRNAARKILA